MVEWRWLTLNWYAKSPCGRRHASTAERAPSSRAVRSCTGDRLAIAPLTPPPNRMKTGSQSVSQFIDTVQCAWTRTLQHVAPSESLATVNCEMTEINHAQWCSACMRQHLLLRGWPDTVCVRITVDSAVQHRARRIVYELFLCSSLSVLGLLVTALAAQPTPHTRCVVAGDVTSLVLDLGFLWGVQHNL